MKKEDIISQIIIIVFFIIIIIYSFCFYKTQMQSKIYIQEEEVVAIATPTPTPVPRPTHQPSLSSSQALLRAHNCEVQMEQYDEEIEKVSQFNSIDEYIEYLTLLQEAEEDNLKFYLEEYEDFIVREEEAKWAERYEEYPVATTIWLYLTTELGLSEECAAGVLGNIMNEAGGNSLDINPEAYNSAGYYGICQWNSSLYSEVQWVGLIEQLDYLKDTIEYEFDTYGNVNYEEFCLIEDEQEAALAFARSYERCSRSSYNIRQRNAISALEYYNSN